MNQSVALRFVGAGLAHVLSDVLQYASQTTTPGVLRGAYLGLFTAWPGFALGLQMPDIIEPTFGGYARLAVTWGDTGIDKTQRPQVFGGLSQFQPTDATVSDTVIGAFLASAVVAGELIAIGQLSQQVILGTVLDVLGILPRFAVPGLVTPDWGEVIGVA
jgi:hypothetical protein